MSTPADYYVYACRDYKGTVRYIGKGRNDRMQQHIHAAKRLIDDPAYKPKTNPFVRWLAHQIRKERHFTFTKLREGLTEHQAFDLETNLINKIGRATQKAGPLLNIMETGGMSSDDATKLWKRHRPKIINGIRNSARKKAHMERLHTDPEILKKHAESVKRRWDDPELRAEQIRKIRTAHADPKTKANVLAAARTRSDSQHWKQKHRAGMQRSAPHRAEQIKKAWAKPGNKLASAETKAKRRAGLLAAWAKPGSKTRSPETMAKRQAAARATLRRIRAQTFNDPRQLRLIDDESITATSQAEDQTQQRAP